MSAVVTRGHNCAAGASRLCQTPPVAAITELKMIVCAVPLPKATTVPVLHRAPPAVPPARRRGHDHGRRPNQSTRRPWLHPFTSRTSSPDLRATCMPRARHAPQPSPARWRHLKRPTEHARCGAAKFETWRSEKWRVRGPTRPSSRPRVIWTSSYQRKGAATRTNKPCRFLHGK